MTVLQYITLAPNVAQALHQRLPVVALETTVLTHGLPYPQNLSLALDIESTIHSHGATPATIGLLDGQLIAGMTIEQLEALIQAKDLRKISGRDIGPAIAQHASGGTTVAATALTAQKAGILVFATGGIGGVHRGSTWDISADLTQLAQTPIVVVCAGAKAILDLPATLEYLETAGIPVLGFQTDEFPAFYMRQSGFPVSAKALDAGQVVEIAHAHWGSGMKSAVLVTVPPPTSSALPRIDVEAAIEQALADAKAQGVRGQATTPFLLTRVSELTGGSSLHSNLELLINNARIATEIA